VLALHIVVCSTRPGRIGPKVAAWFLPHVRSEFGFTTKIVDLAEVNLPMFDEPHHPMKRAYVHPHTQAWSALVDAADAYVFVTPEYNFSTPPALVNALNYLHHEWRYKPAGFVSYGGISGGLRSVQMSRTMLTALGMMPIPEGVSLPFAGKAINAEGAFDPGAVPDASAAKLLSELAKWGTALRTLRHPPAA
jgi:NAD(P)H-dependent FMN reductase